MPTRNLNQMNMDQQNPDYLILESIPLPIRLILMGSETGLFINNLKSFLQNNFSCFSVLLTNSSAMSSHTIWYKVELEEILL